MLPHPLAKPENGIVNQEAAALQLAITLKQTGKRDVAVLCRGNQHVVATDETARALAEGRDLPPRQKAAFEQQILAAHEYTVQAAPAFVQAPDMPELPPMQREALFPPFRKLLRLLNRPDLLAELDATATQLPTDRPA